MSEEKKELVQGAGNLHDEMEELRRAIPNDTDTEIYSTSTRVCSGFLTIHCC